MIKSLNVLLNGVQIPCIVDDSITVTTLLDAAMPRVMIGTQYVPADWELHDENDQVMAGTDDLTGVNDGGNVALVFIG